MATGDKMMDVGGEIKEALGLCICKGCTREQHIARHDMCRGHMEESQAKAQQMKKAMKEAGTPETSPYLHSKEELEASFRREYHHHIARLKHVARSKGKKG